MLLWSSSMSGVGNRWFLGCLEADLGVEDNNMPDLRDRSQKRLGFLVLSAALLKIRSLALGMEFKSKRQVLEFSVCRLKRVKTTNIVIGGNLN